MPTSLYKNILCIGSLMILTACSASSRVIRPPVYQQPVIQTDEQYRYADLNWKKTETLKSYEADWWQIYQDPQLNQLIVQLNRENLSLKQAAARFRYAGALLDQQRATRQPDIIGNNFIKREGSKDASSSSYVRSELQISWMPDLWGRVAKAIEGQQANLEAATADLQAVKLNQQLLAVQAYWNLRSADEQLHILKKTEQNYGHSLKILKNQYSSGIVARANVIQTEIQLQQLQIQRIEIQRERQLQENILAVLQGKTATQFQLKQQQKIMHVPELPAQVPSRLLLQRPDVLFRERELAATHAQLGLAQTAWLPDIAISLNGTLHSQLFSQLLQSPQSLWSIGLSAAGLVWDGGKRRAETAAMQANYEEKTLAYRQAVLNGWKEVEDALLHASSFKQQKAEQEKLLALALENERTVLQRYNAGLVSYLEVTTAQNMSLQAEQNVLETKKMQLNNTAQLIAAMGGNIS